MKRFTKDKVINFVSIALVATAITFSSVTLAKFVSQDDTKTPIRTAYFYFNCSKAENETYVLNIKDGETTASTSFTVNNYVFDVASYENINYQVTLIDDETSISTLIKDDVLEGQKISEATIDVTGLVEGKTYTVVVSSDVPYVRQYSFKYYVAKKELATYYTVKDNGTWIQLDLYIGDTVPNEGITVVYGDKLSPNPTLDSMAGWESINQHVITNDKLQVNTHYIFQFVELVAGEYSISDKTSIVDNKITL